MTTTSILARIAAAWATLAPPWEAYRLVLPGDASFICQPEVCRAHCCRAFSVALGDHEMARLQQRSGLLPEAFLEVEDGRPVRLPLARPYLLARSENRCALLGADLRCTQYEGRPDACRLYPHFVVAINQATGRVERGTDVGLAARVTGALAGSLQGEVVPVLLRHVECPGFTGPPLDSDAWARLFLETARLQSAVDGCDGPPP